MCTAAHDDPHRHSLLCILPLYLLLGIARNGTPEQRAAALVTLAADEEMRSVRAGAAAVRPVAPTVAPDRAKAAAVRRTIYYATHRQRLPGKVVRREGAAPSSGPSVDEAYYGVGATFDSYRDACRRNSIDDAGMPAHESVHYGGRYDNAFWDGTQMVFGDGDGDGKLFNRFTIALNVIGREFTHGVTARGAALVYQGQPGALNESMSDAFGSLVKQYAAKQDVAHADWLIGASLLAKSVQGVALRSIKARGTAYDYPALGRDPQPAHMKDYFETTDDDGGVHLNSGISNRAFCVAAIAIGGNAWERAGRIWYDTLRNPEVVGQRVVPRIREAHHHRRGPSLQGRQRSGRRDAGLARRRRAVVAVSHDGPPMLVRRAAVRGRTEHPAVSSVPAWSPTDVAGRSPVLYVRRVNIDLETQSDTAEAWPHCIPLRARDRSRFGVRAQAASVPGGRATAVLDQAARFRLPRAGAG